MREIDAIFRAQSARLQRRWDEQIRHGDNWPRSR